MTDERDRDEVMDRRLDWALREDGGSAVPPDVSARVVARFRAGEVVEVGDVVPPRSRRWLMAAAMLLGLGVVVAVSMSRRAGPSSVAPAVAPQGGPAPTFVIVTNRVEIDALPPDTRLVEGLNLCDADIAALAKLSKLEGLKLLARSRTNDEPPLRLLTEAALPTLATMRSLRILHLDWQTKLSGKRLDFLKDLPRLEELALKRFDTDDATLAVLERMPSLRRLDLGQNHTFYDETMMVLARCPGIRSLSLDACCQLNGEMLAPLASMRQLEELDLGILPMPPEERAAFEASFALVKRSGTGLTDAVLANLGDKPRLRKLDLSRGRFTDDGLQALAKCTALEELSIQENPELDGKGAASIPPTVRRLDLSFDPWVEARVMSLLPVDLRELIANDSLNIDDDALKALVARCPHLRHVELRRCKKVTKVGIDHLLQLREIQPSKLDGMSSSAPLVLALPVDAFGAENARFVKLVNPTLPAIAALQELRECEWLDVDGTQPFSWRSVAGSRGVVISPEPETSQWISDAGVRELAKMSKLRHLTLASNRSMSGETIGDLAALPVLETLDLRLLRIEDDALLALPKFPALRALLFDEPLGLTGAGIATLTRCQSLRTLRLTNCPQLSGADLAQLGAMTALEDLDLGQLPEGGELTMAKDRSDAHWNTILDRAATTTFLNSGGGLDDAALAGLQSLTNLRRLGLANGRFTRAGLAALLAKLTKLERLDLSGCGFLATDDMATLPPTLRSLAIDDCAAMDGAAIAALGARCPQLTTLSASGPKLNGADESFFRVALPQLKSLRRKGTTGH